MREEYYIRKTERGRCLKNADRKNIVTRIIQKKMGGERRDTRQSEVFFGRKK